MSNHSTETTLAVEDRPRRRAAGAAGIALLLMAVVAPVAQFGVLDSLVVPSDAVATVENVVASPGLFRAAGFAFVIVALLDVVVAWTLHVVLREVNRIGSLVTAWLRTVYGAVLFGSATHLFDAARLAADPASLSADGLQAKIMNSLSGFHTGFEEIGLAIFAFHLFGLGHLVYKSADFPRFLGALVVIAGAGYLFDSAGQMLVADFDATAAQFTFIGEALMIVWLFWRAAKGFSTEAISGTVRDPHSPRSVPVRH